MRKAAQLTMTLTATEGLATCQRHKAATVGLRLEVPAQDRSVTSSKMHRTALSGGGSTDQSVKRMML